MLRLQRLEKIEEVVPETKPFSATRCAFDISMPRGFIASTAPAENVEAARMRWKTVGLVAVRKVVRANIDVGVVEEERTRLVKGERAYRSRPCYSMDRRHFIDT